VKVEERTVEIQEWTVKNLMEALKRFPPEAKVYYEMGPNGPGTIGKAQYVNVWGDDELGVLLDRQRRVCSSGNEIQHPLEDEQDGLDDQLIQ
jgi:hypothetical protein